MQDLMHRVEIVHHFGGGTYAKETRIPAGLILSQHVHQHDHLSLLVCGTVRLSIDGEVQTMTAEQSRPVCLTIKAGKEHKVESITDVVWFCIHATDETDPEKIDHVLIEEH